MRECCIIRFWMWGLFMSDFFKIKIFRKKNIMFMLFVIIFINFLNFYFSNNQVTYLNVNPLQSCWNMNLLMTGTFTMAGLIYSFLAFIMASLPLSNSLVEDGNCGILDQIAIRMPIKTYIVKTYIYNFLAGGLFVIMPLVINIVLWMLVRPMFAMNYISAGLANFIFLSDLFVKSPLLFHLIHLFIVFIGGGLIASFSLYLNTKFNNKYIGFLLVLVIDLLASLIFYFVSIVLNKDIVLVSLRSLLVEMSFSNPLISLIYLLTILLIPIYYLYKLAKRRY